MKSSAVTALILVVSAFISTKALAIGCGDEQIQRGCYDVQTGTATACRCDTHDTIDAADPSEEGSPDSNHLHVNLNAIPENLKYLILESISANSDGCCMHRDGRHCPCD